MNTEDNVCSGVFQGAKFPMGLWDELQQSLSWQTSKVSSVVKQKSLSHPQSPIAWDCGTQCWVSAVVGSRDCLLTHRRMETESRDVPYCSPVCVEEPGRQQTQPGWAGAG